MNEKPWKRCQFCSNGETSFQSPFQFGNHLRMYHSRIEGGSHVCCYGMNGMCPLLPYEGVSDRDYETHIAKCHIFLNESSSSSMAVKQSSKTIMETHQSTVDQKSSRKKSSAAASVTTSLQGRYREKFDFPKPRSSSENADLMPLQSSWNNRPNVVIDGDKWNIFSTSQDLTSVLNDPFKPRSHYDNLLTKDWGFNFVDPQHIPPYAIVRKPSKLLLESYLSKISKRDRQQNFNKLIQQNSNSQTASLSPDEFLSYDLVPSLFFQSDFSIENGETFSRLLSSFNSKNSATKNLDQDNGWTSSIEEFFQQHSMSDVQKLLSDNLDSVEQDLARQISKRSNDFFHVMSSMDSVMDRLKILIKQVASIRMICLNLNQQLVEPIQQNIRLTQLRSQYRDIHKKVTWISTVHQTQPTIQLLLSKNDYAGALDLISTSQEVVAQELNGVISFRYLRLQLMEIEKVIEQMLNEEFVKYLTAEWNRPLTPDSNDGIQREKLLSIIYGMLKLQNFGFVNMFREEAFTAIKTNVKQSVIEILSHEDDGDFEMSRTVENQTKNLFEQLKRLSLDKWIGSLGVIFDRLVILLRRVKLVFTVINDGFETIANNYHKNINELNQENKTLSEVSNFNQTISDTNNSKIILPSDYYELSSSLKDVLFSVCDFAHSRLAQIIEIRVTDNSLDKLDCEDFRRLVNLIDQFIVDGEKICQRRSNSLKLVIQIQSNRFVTKFHEEMKRKLKQLLDLEQWRLVNNINQDFQDLCSKFLNIGNNNNGCDTEIGLSNIYNQYKDSKLSSKSSDNSSSNSGTLNCVLLNEEKFLVVNTVINLLFMILDYCDLAEKILFLTPEMLLRLVDLLKLFNSRTSQLVLGAEALQIAGLKTISARTLIISMRSLIFVLRFIPSIRKHFEELLMRQKTMTNNSTNNNHNNTMLKHLTDLNELYENHYGKIPEKVIGLVRDVVDSNLNKWIAKAPVPSASFQTISQHLSRLHDNIQDILPASDLLGLFQKIHQHVISVFNVQLTKLKISNDGGPQHGFVTQELAFYTRSLKNLSIGTSLDLSTDQLWAN